MLHPLSKEKVLKYLTISKEALTLAKESKNRTALANEREDFIDMISRYLSDGEYFLKKGDLVNAFAAFNYAHGWLDAGARIGLFDVKDSRLFTVDD